MTKTESPALAAYTPGKHEAEALRYMHEWEPSSRVPSKHIVAQQTAGGIFQAFEWSLTRKVWRPWNGVHASATRNAVVDAMLAEIEWANLSIMDEPIDFADYEGFAPDEFDHCVFCERHTLLCPVGAPGGGDGWTEVGVNADGTGRSFGGAASNPNHVNDSPFFSYGGLAARYRKLALPVERVALGYEKALRVPPVLVRHHRVARQIVPKAGWGIINRPDLMARRIDRELAVNAAVEAEGERQRKAGEYQTPPAALQLEIGSRMEKEWAEMDALAA